MPRDPDSSPQTVAVLRSFLGDSQQWRYGYDLARETALKSGTLYPILARLADRGYLERQWEPDPPGGKPPRHLYRLTPTGMELAARVVPARRARAQGVTHLRWEGA